MADTPLIEMRGASIGYAQTAIAQNIDLSVFPGDSFSLVGPNGAGKSTLLKTLLGIIPILGGKLVRKPGLQLGYVPQRSRIDPLYPMSALEVVRQGGMGRNSGGLGFRPSSEKEGRSALSRLDIESMRQKRFRDLSGGQQQRVLIARALVRNPELLVLDEPTEGLDLPSEKQILDFISSLNRNRKMTVILVSHKLSIIADRVRRVALINKDTRLFAVGEGAEILTDEKLSMLYGYPMITERKNGRLVSVRAGAADDEAAV